MLGTGARYAEYGITGGFFLFTQALILGLAYPDVLVSGAHSFGVLLNASVGTIPEEARPAIQSLLVALALLGVFIIGLVLEIIGSIFMLYEANVFRNRLAMNPWVARFVEAELPDYAEDYRLVLNLANLWSHYKEELKPKNWLRSLRRPLGGFQWQRQVHQRFRRFESVLIAKVLTSGAKTEIGRSAGVDAGFSAERAAFHDRGFPCRDRVLVERGRGEVPVDRAEVRETKSIGAVGAVPQTRFLHERPPRRSRRPPDRLPVAISARLDR